MLHIDNPDYDVENFWLQLKPSIVNFYEVKKLKIRPIGLWSKRLDELQLKKKYQEITKCINNYIYLFCIDVMKYGDLYHSNILIKNIDRWNNIKNNLFQKEPMNKKVYNLLKIFYSLLEKNIPIEPIFFDIDLMLLMNDYYPLVNLSLHQKLSLPLDLLGEIFDLKSFLLEHFDLNIKPTQSGRKIIKAFTDRNHNHPHSCVSATQ